MSPQGVWLLLINTLARTLCQSKCSLLGSILLQWNWVGRNPLCDFLLPALGLGKNLSLSSLGSEEQALTWGTTRSRGSLHRFTWWQKKQVLGNIYSANCMAQKRAMLCEHPLLRYWALYVTHLVVQGDLVVLLALVNLPALCKRKTQTRENCCYGATAAMETVNILLLEALTIKGGLRWDLGDLSPRWSREGRDVFG